MKKIERNLKITLNNEWNSGKVLIILGPRQVGKTTLIKDVCEENGDFLFFNGDDYEDKMLLTDTSENKLRLLIGNHKTVFVDEAQKIKDIGTTLKIIHDRIPDVRVIVSGSSALDIANSVNEPLTGRKWEHQLFPISWNELIKYQGYKEVRKNLNHHLVFGMYPEVLMNPFKAEDILKELANSYLYKDILQFDAIRKPEVIDKLLLALALQVGAEINYNELSNSLRIDRVTVENYISLLEKAFIVFRLHPFAKNVRNEISTNRKVYFYDNGIRNAILRNYLPLENRQDVGALWENFLIAEKIKIRSYQKWNGRNYFWRTYAQQEIDYIEESNGNLSAYEFKWNPKAKAKFPSTFISNYNPIEKLIVTPDNMDEFLKE
jgi:predicted AAA+ superfamily ATPase